ncbi:MAG TPA: AAA family ATPase [Burkholderiales bacterium]
MTHTGAIVEQETLIAALQDPRRYPHPVERVERLETHISYVLLAGDYAYKIKKAVDLGFLDFRTLSARKHYCEEELRLNRRLARDLYLDVVPVTGSPDRPVLGGAGPVMEYAVKMRRFPQEQLLSRLIAEGRLTGAHIDALADEVAEFHARAAVASPADGYGTPAAIATPARDNFAQIRAAGAAPDMSALAALERWTTAQLDALDPEFRRRKRAGCVRECHGDLHLGNVALIDDRVTIFDALEFSADLRWIDVINEIAFTVMDLQDRRRPDFARRFLNRYLEHTGDYPGLALLPFYVVYRALVRAKVHWLRAHQPGVDDAARARLVAQYRAYLALARRETEPRRPALVVTHGFSGSGKTTHTQALIEAIDAVRLRSDVERKRLHGLPALARTGSGISEGVYAADATARTYARLLELAGHVLAAGYSAVVDATFLQRAPRDAFRRLAAARGVPFVIVDFAVDEATLRARLAARARSARDASEADVAVLEHQLATHEPLAPDELDRVERFNAALPPDSAAAHTEWRRVCARLATHAA